jgi:hypothetical protein
MRRLCSAVGAMIRKSSSKVSSFFARLYFRHSVSIKYDNESYTEVYDWVQEKVGKRSVWVNYNTETCIDANGVIVQMITDNRLEFRFRKVTDAIMFKLTFVDILFTKTP